MNIVLFTLPTRNERIAMHLRFLWRRPAQWRFHVAGLLREFLPCLDREPTPSAKADARFPKHHHTT